MFGAERACEERGLGKPEARRFGTSEGSAELEGLERAGAAGPYEGRDTDNRPEQDFGALKGEGQEYL